ncbi:hypothetical protein CSAL01_05342 [Colletotrichum salicis]|uniref:Uncharacterized protein n=1 Tax=Colletotrichum salicis TaxID=1209931 RepID=A0A135U584_9PEZI|nr:hypothetical protein CSAL01_05342 [Colletotrichum salicis]
MSLSVVSWSDVANLRRRQAIKPCCGPVGFPYPGARLGSVRMRKLVAIASISSYRVAADSVPGTDTIVLDPKYRFTAFNIPVTCFERAGHGISEDQTSNFAITLRHSRAPKSRCQRLLLAAPDDHSTHDTKRLSPTELGNEMRKNTILRGTHWGF